MAADVRKSARLDKRGRAGSGWRMRCFFLFCCCLFCCAPRAAWGGPPVQEASAEDAVNLYCLRLAYPVVRALEPDGDGGQWLVLADGRRVLYSRARGEGEGREFLADPWDVDVRASMADLYPLEPERPATPEGVAPGRRRSYALLAALYGSDARQVGKGLRTAHVLGQPVRLAATAARALQKMEPRLAESVREQPELRALLKTDGGFLWRRVAGEQRLSPHAYGVALDLSARRAPYWRWSRLRPHPMQQSYPSAIVAAFEAEGFIWGGKWHEYDLMHFEYRPELVCKARILRGLEKMNAADATTGGAMMKEGIRP